MSLQKLWATCSTTTSEKHKKSDKQQQQQQQQQRGFATSSATTALPVPVEGTNNNPGRSRRQLLFSRVYDSMSQVLGLRDIQDYLQGNTASLPLSCNPLWLLGTPYIVAEKVEASGGNPEKLQPIEEAWEEFLSDFRARLWVTYRKDFPPIGASGLTSDVGWGCTYRSGQMMLAEALQRAALLGRGEEGEAAAAREAAQRSVARRFWDRPEDEAPYSIHNICAVGSSHGVVPGEWLGPYVICKTLAAVVNSREGDAGLRVHVASEPSGGAPMICSRLPAPPSDGNDEAGAANDFPQLLLVPLTLGVEKMNPVYHSQLKAVLRLPQSVGIVGGRPSSSLYFIGTQDDHLLYLDPHFTRPTPASDDDYGSFHCSTVRHLPITHMDPSVAIGFFCASAEDFLELCSGLADIEAAAGTAPLMTVRDEVPPSPGRQGLGLDWSDDALCGTPTTPGAKGSGSGQEEEEGGNETAQEGGEDEDEWELM